MFIKIGEWLPDQGQLGNPGSPVIKNLIPTKTGYRSIPALGPKHVPIVPQLPGEVIQGETVYPQIQDLIWVKDSNGDIRSIAASRDKVYHLGVGLTTQWVECGLTSQGRVATNVKIIYFKREILVLNGVQALRRFDSEAEAPNCMVEVPTSPAAKVGATVRDFLMVGNIAGNPTRVQWSAFNDYTTWDNDISNQSGYFDVPSEYGDITAIIGGEEGYIFQEQAIHKVSYIGAPLIFRIDLVARDIGALFVNGAKEAHNGVYFYAKEGMHLLENDKVIDIGANKINNWLSERVFERGRMQLEVFEKERILVLGFASSQDYWLDVFVIYSWEANKWAQLEMPPELSQMSFFGEIRSSDLSLEDLDNIFGVNMDMPRFTIPSGVDGVPDTVVPVPDLSVDDFFSSSERVFAFINNNGRTYAFRGEDTYMAGECQSARHIVDDRVIRIQTCRAMCSGDTNIENIQLDVLSGPALEQGSDPAQNYMYVPARNQFVGNKVCRNFNIRLKTHPTSRIEDLRGFDVQYQECGTR